MNNLLTLCGHVGLEPRVVTFGDTGNKVTKFSIAVQEFGNNEETTLWVDVDAWNGIGERIMATVTRGRELVVSGKLAINKYNKQLEDGTTIEVHKPVLKLTTFHLCGPKPKTGESSVAEAPAKKAQSTRVRSSAKSASKLSI